MKAWFVLFIAIVIETFATSMLKISEGFTRPLPTVSMVLGYIVSLYLLTITLKVLPISIAYAIWSGVGIVLISLIGWFFMGQKLDSAAIIGIAFICLGVLIINLFSNS